MEIFKRALHLKIDVFVKFKSAINLEIRGQIFKKLDFFYLGYRGMQCMHFHQNLGRSRLILHFFWVI